MKPLKENKKLNVLISGASIAGLSTAYWLIKYGFKVTIVERAKHIRAGGQAVDVRGPALEVAERMGILDDIRNNSTKLKGMSLVDAVSGKEIYSNTKQTLTGGRHDSPDVEILRDDLCNVLFKAVGNKAKYIFDDTIVAIVQDESGVDVTFEHTALQRFDLVIGADGIRSNVRRLVFGDDKEFIRYLGHYVAIFTIPNFFGLDHWEMIFQYGDTPVSVCIAKEKENEARTYLGFSSDEPLEYDYRDIDVQKRLIAERAAPNVGGMISKIKELMHGSSNFYFDSVNQTIMNNWSKGRVVLVGDAGYSVSLTLGQSTSVAMVGAYVLSGELSNKQNLKTAFSNYESELREYVETNQNLAFKTSTEPQQTIGESSKEGTVLETTDLPDFGLSVISIALKNYS